MTCHKGRPITQFDVIELFTTAYNTSATVVSVTNGFMAAGQLLFNDSKFDDELGNNDEAAQFVPVRNPVGDEDDMQAEPVVNVSSRDQSLVQVPTTLFRKQSVIPDQHRRSLYLLMHMQVTIDQDVLQPEQWQSVLPPATLTEDI